MVKIIAWNIAHRDGPWRELLNSDADLALLSEAAAPPRDVASQLDIDPSPWFTTGSSTNRPWKAAIVRLSDRVTVNWIESKPVQDANSGELAISRPGTLSAAVVQPASGEPFVAASMYAVWERPLRGTGSSWIYADASAHRLISDLSVFIGNQFGHRILAAGDLNILYGYGEHGSRYWAGRYASIFSRMEDLGFSFLGPQSPSGRRADPWPNELPAKSLNVPTYHTNRQSPEAASRQLDFAFASSGFAKQIGVKALNEPEKWGPSDHCRLEIDVEV